MVKKRLRSRSLSGTLRGRRFKERSLSLPSLVTKWTCIRCLLSNNPTATAICTACGASSLISETHGRQIGARKCKRLEPGKNNNSLKQVGRLDLVTKVTTGLVTRVHDSSTNTLKISTRRERIHDIPEMAQLTGISRSERTRNNREDWTLPSERIDSSVTPYVDNVDPSQRSPKRHSPSMYERVKSKVSRSLSNGSVVQKLSDNVLPRPTSLIVSEAHQDDALWSCDNCTLNNASGLEQCEACEAPRSPAPCSGVVISVPVWDTRALSSAGPLCYRRSFSEVDAMTSISQRKVVNRRSLNDKEPPEVPPHSAAFNSRPKYSYIGITDPDIPPPLPKKQSNKLNLPVTQRSQAEASSPLGDRTANSPLKRMWTCRKCSYAYNPLWSGGCDICGSSRSPPSLTQPSLITVTKDSVNSRQAHSPIVVSRDSVRYIPSRPAGYFTESDSEDLVELGPGWTCKKCTLLNPATRTTCEACGGSKLRSVSHLDDPTLRKSESWVCQSCTLRNPLTAITCNACKNQSFSETPRENRLSAQRSPSPRLNCPTPTSQKVVTPRHRNSVKRNGSGLVEKKYTKAKDSGIAQVRFFFNVPYDFL